MSVGWSCANGLLLSKAAILLQFLCRHIQNEASAKVFQQVCAGLEVSCHALDQKQLSSSVRNFDAIHLLRPRLVKSRKEHACSASCSASLLLARKACSRGCSAILTCEDARASWQDVLSSDQPGLRPVSERKSISFFAVQYPRQLGHSCARCTSGMLHTLGRSTVV